MRRIFACIAILLCLAGCASPYYKSVDGTSLILGISLPDEQYLQINALSYLGGGKVVVRDACNVQHEYQTASTNSYFGLVTTREYRRAKISLTPVSTNCVETIKAER